MSKPSDDVAKLVAKLAKKVEAVMAADPEFAPQVLKPGEPAHEDDIAAYEKALGFTLPPSYRAFLQMHDGYDGLSLVGNFLSLNDVFPNGRLNKVIENWKTEENLKNVIVIAEVDGQPDCVYLDPAKKNASGEYRVIEWSHEDEPEAFPDFPAYLEECMLMCDEWIEDAQSEK